MARFGSRWRLATEEEAGGDKPEFVELLNIPDMYIFRYTVPLYFNNQTANWVYKIRCNYNLHGFRKWYVTIVESMCPQKYIGRRMRNIYVKELVNRMKEAIRELLSADSNRWKSRFVFNDIYEPLKDGEQSIKVCNMVSGDVTKTMWHLYTTSKGNVTLSTSVLYSGRPYKFRVTTDVFNEHHYRINWDFEIGFDLLMASFHLEKVYISCPELIE
ncbi:unnamed protein product [Caenorhabditis bovis]|nr:unnamed protein product [Caenorhabditis bovis]